MGFRGSLKPELGVTWLLTATTQVVMMIFNNALNGAFETRELAMVA